MHFPSIWIKSVDPNLFKNVSLEVNGNLSPNLSLAVSTRFL